MKLVAYLASSSGHSLLGCLRKSVSWFFILFSENRRLFYTLVVTGFSVVPLVAFPKECKQFYEKVYPDWKAKNYRKVEVLLNTLSDKTSPCYIIMQGNLWEAYGEYWMQAQMYENAAKHHPENLDIRKRHLVSLHQGGEIEKARHFSALYHRRSDPNIEKDPFFAHLPALLLFYEGRVIESRKTFAGLIAKDPENVNYILDSIQSDAVAGVLKPSEDKLRKAFDLGISEYGKNVGYYGLAKGFLFNGDTQRAKHYWDEMYLIKEQRSDMSIAELSILLKYRQHDMIKRLEENKDLPVNKNLKLFYAGLKAMTGKPDELKELIRHASIKKEPFYHVRLALTLIALDWKEKDRYAKIALKKLPNSIAIRFYLFLSTKNKAQRERLRKELRKIVPQNRLVKHLQR